MVALQGRTSDDHCNITATGTLPRAFSGGVASAARELGIQQNDFQQSTTGISTNNGLWFSWLVVFTARAAAAGGAWDLTGFWQQHVLGGGGKRWMAAWAKIVQHDDL